MASISDTVTVVDTDRVLRFAKELAELNIATEAVSSREVASTPLLEWMLAQRSRGKEGLREIRKMTCRAGRLLAKMHNAGLFHDNLQSESLRVRTDGKTPQCVVMNLHQMRRVRWPRRQVRVRNLARSLHACFCVVARWIAYGFAGRTWRHLASGVRCAGGRG